MQRERETETEKEREEVRERVRERKGSLCVSHQSRGPFHRADIGPGRFCVRCIPLDCNRGELLNLLHISSVRIRLG